MNVNNLRVGKSKPDALMFDKYIYTPVYNFLFADDWELNPEQADGVKIVDGKIVVTKFKPNVWFAKSNYGFSTDAERNAKFYNKIFKVTGLAAANAAGKFTQTQVNTDGGGYYSKGLVMSPMGSTGGFMLSAWPWETGSTGGAFKDNYTGGNVGWNLAGYVLDYPDGKELYNSNVNTGNVPSWGGKFWEAGFGLFTDVAPGADGFITLDEPIIISPDNTAYLDPTTKEGWRAYLDGKLVYSKDKTFMNCLVRHGLAVKDVDHYDEQVQGMNPSIQMSDFQRKSDQYGTPYAYVVTGRNYKDGDWKGLSLPVITDLEERIAEGFPMKFWINQEDIEGREGFWKSVLKAFKNQDSSDPQAFDCIFTNSNIKGSYYPEDNGFVTLNINKPYSTEVGAYVSLGMAFDHSKVDKVEIIVKSGRITSILDCFRQTPNLTEVRFINQDSENENACAPAQFAGAFEYSALKQFPSGLGCAGVTNLQSENTCQISYAFHGVAMPTIGTMKSETERWNMLIIPYCEYAFDSDAITSILYRVDMKFVNPASGANRVFSCKNLASAQICGLNKGNWYLDGTAHNGTIHGDLSSLDAESVNYLLNNLFDLRRNTEEADYIESALTTFVRDWTCTKESYITYAYWHSDNSGSTVTHSNVPSGTMKLRIKTNIIGQLKVTNNGSVTNHQVSDGNTLSIPVSAGSLSFEVTWSGEGVIDVYIENVGRTELTRNLTSSSLYLPQSLRSKMSNDAIREANARGWTIYTGNQQVTV